MGTWGTSILDNDLAADLQDQWKELLGEGYDPEDISYSIIESAEEEGLLKDPEDEYEFWLSFALIQWKTGRLQSNVKDKALNLLTEKKISEIENNRWDDSKVLKKRLTHLQKLKETLNTQPPAPKKISKSFKQTTVLLKGDLISIRLKSEKYIVLEIIDIDLSHGAESPIAVLYNYYSKSMPSVDALKDKNLIEFSLSDLGFPNVKHTNFILGAATKKQREPVERIIFLKRNRLPKVSPHMPQGLCFWSEIDTLLEEWVTQKNVS